MLIVNISIILRSSGKASPSVPRRTLGPGSKRLRTISCRRKSRMDGHFATIHPFGSSAATGEKPPRPVALRPTLSRGLPFRG
jgi:hypothetical protein